MTYSSLKSCVWEDHQTLVSVVWNFKDVDLVVVAGCKGFGFKRFSLHVQYSIHDSSVGCEEKKGWGQGGIQCGSFIDYKVYYTSVWACQLAKPFFTAVQPGLKRNLWIALVLDSHNTGLII